MLLPKKTKFRKYHRGRLVGIANSNNQLVYGSYGLQALEPVWLTSRQIEATRRTLSRNIKVKFGKIYIRIFPDKPITMRAAESRMGAGKGSVSYWVACIYPGNILFELSKVSHELAIKSLSLAQYKLPIKTRIISK
jgi:large subunit ribosomal protein L16